MKFWKQFYNQPMLWGLAFAMVIGLGLFVYKTPNLLMMQGGGVGLFGQWIDIPATNYAGANPKGDQNFIVDILTNYPAIAGITLSMKDTGGEIMSQGTAKYNFWAGLSVLVVMLLGVIYATRKSRSAIFILGPLFAFLIISMIVTVKAVVVDGYTMSVNVGDAIFNWALMFGGTALGVFFVVRHLINKGLVRGIDEDGPLDFSRLKEATLSGAGQAARVAGGIGDRLQNTIGNDGEPVASPTSNNNPTAPIAVNHSPTEQKPTVVKHNYCIMCGSTLNGRSKCKNCLQTTGTVVLSKNGQCQECGSGKAVRAKYCFYCGTWFENEPSTDNYTNWKTPELDGDGMCKECQHSLQSGDKFCQNCGTSVMSQN